MVRKVSDIKTTDTSDLVQKIDCNTKNHDHGEYITTQEFNKFTGDIFDARLKQVNLANKTDTADLIKNRF